MEHVEDIIKEYITTYNVSHDGWHSVYCEVCGDGKRTQGPRGGWLFNGDIIMYHCFNCSINGNFDHTREQPFSEEMWKILKAFDVSFPRIKKVIDTYIINNNFKTKEVKKQKRKLSYLDIPDYFIALEDSESPTAQKARKFLSSRHINYKDYPFYISSGKSTNGIKDEIIAKTLLNRVIIPFMHNGKMIYYQARTLISKHNKKYINANTSRTNIIYGMDLLYKNMDNYLFVTEGFFDAYHLNGVSVQDNHLSTAQIDILNQSPRKKVIVPDYNGDNYTLAEQAIELGWGVSLPQYPNSFKDTSDAIEGIGKLSTLQYIMNSIYFDYEAETHLMVHQMN